MSVKKELNKEELEKVTGGAKTISEVNWLFTKDAQVYVQLSGGTKVEGKVSKRGYIGSYGGPEGTFVLDFYYIESLTDTNINGWYVGLNFTGNTVCINKKSVGLTEPTIEPW